MAHNVPPLAVQKKPAGRHPHSTLTGSDSRSSTFRLKIQELRHGTLLQRLLSVRLLLLVSFAVLVIAVGSISYSTASVSFGSTTSALSDQILDNVVLRVAAAAQQLLDVPYFMAQSAGTELYLKQASVLDIATLRPILWRVWKDSDYYLSSFTVTFTDGTFFGYSYTGGYVFELYVNYSESPHGKYSFVTDFNNGYANFTAFTAQLVPDLNYTSLEYFVELIKRQEQIWSAPYIVPQIPYVYFTSSVPIFDTNNGKFVGGFGASVNSFSLQAVLKGIYISKNAKIWIMEPSGIMIACSDPLENVNNDNATTYAFTYAQQSNLELVRETSIRILHGNTSDNYEYKYTHKGLAYTAYTYNIGYNDLDLMLLVAYPNDDFLGGVQTVKRNILIITLVVLAAAIGVGIWVMFLVTAPLSRLGQQMDQISIGAFESELLNRSARKSSRLFEIHALQTDFQRMVNALRSFSKFVPVDVVRHILLNDTEATAGVTQKEVTVMFSDIKGFTQKVEEMSAQQLSMLLSDYLSAMCTVIGDNKGTVDKFIGDAIMALWNAPTAVKNHPSRACAAALESVNALERLNMKWRMNGLPDIQCRIGIHTGKALVGNLGSNERLAYTAVGDNINLGSRLEALNKKYGTSILISGEVYRRIGDEYLCRFMDVVVVQGRTMPTPLYELVAKTTSATPEQFQLCRSQAEALELFFNRKFTEALTILHSLQVAYPSDISIKSLIERTEEAQAIPDLNEDWKGYYVLIDK